MTSQMGLNLAGANIVSPAASVDYEDYVSTFLEMRKKKGMSRELAQDSMVDPLIAPTLLSALRSFAWRALLAPSGPDRPMMQRC